MKRIVASLILVSFLALPACVKQSESSGQPDDRIVVTTATFDQLVNTSTNLIVLDFWASWCGPCKMMDPIFAEVARERPNMIFGKVNVDQEPALAKKFEVRAIPTLLIMRHGKVVNTSVGFREKAALLQLVDEAAKKR